MSAPMRLIERRLLERAHQQGTTLKMDETAGHRVGERGAGVDVDGSHPLTHRREAMRTTVTLIPTRKVNRVQIGSQVLPLPKGTTDVNAMDAVRPYVRWSVWMCAYAGDAADSTLIVVSVRNYDWAAAEKRLAILQKKAL